MHIAIMPIAESATVAVIAQSVLATPHSAFTFSAPNSAHLANLDAELLTRTTNPLPVGPPAAPF